MTQTDIMLSEVMAQELADKTEITEEEIAALHQIIGVHAQALQSVWEVVNSIERATMREDICDNTHKLLLGVVNAFRGVLGEKDIKARAKQQPLTTGMGATPVSPAPTQTPLVDKMEG